MADELEKLNFKYLLWFTLKTKFRIAFLSDKTAVKNILRGLYFLFLMGMGVLYGFLYNIIMAKSNIAGIDIKAKVFIIVTIIVVLVIRNYLPTFNPPSTLISRIYPVKNYQKTIINIGSDLVTSVTIFMTGFIIPFTLVAQSYTILDVLLLMIMGMSAILIDRGIRIQMEYETKSGKRLFSGTVLILIAFIAFLTQLYWFYNQLFVVIWGISLLLLTISFLYSIWVDTSIDGTPKAHKRRDVTTDAPSVQSMFRHIYLRDKKYRRLLISLLIKIMLIYEVSLVSHEQSVFTMALFISMIMSPSIIFSYIHNNFFGHFRELWLGSKVYTHDPRFIFKLYLQSLVFPLLVDFSLTIVLLGVGMYLGFLTMIWVLGYLVQLIMFIYLGFFISIQKPIKITENMGRSFKRSTSQLYSLLMIVFVIFTGFVIVMKWYWFFLLVIPAAYVMHRKMFDFYESRSHTVYSTIF